MNRFDMAYALIKRAKLRRNEIGDHGDPYEEAILYGIVSVEIQIVLKEVLEHLRSALDYTAMEVVERITGKVSRRIYFPIVKSEDSPEEINKKVEKALPGVNKINLEIIKLFESFQYSDWLSKFATVCNESKHQKLSVVAVDNAFVEVYNKQGIEYMSFFRADGQFAFNRGLPLVTIIDGKANYVKIDSIDEELLRFLDDCIKGSEQIIHTIVEVMEPLK
ncbi:hypothetical protein MKY27_17715 [Solibacillus sp. FSL R5-0449]|uniref:hypothetical protein n=1 Tax=Solibacillus sp. FSL R5-0449 TaxID=2921639 RepID=UPI0030CDD7A2